jgi:hypothetical protein
MGVGIGSKDKNARAARQMESRRVATTQNEAVFAAMDKRASENFFANRGFSAHTIKTLIANGVSLPEELLVMTPNKAERIPGLDQTGLSEVRAYRKRFRGPS